MFHTTSPDPTLLVRSLAFLPTASGVHTEDGIPHPTLSGGWTLNYEMYFYVIFAIALAWSRRWATGIASAVLLVVLAAVQLTRLRDEPVAYFYGHPIVLEFAFGIAAFHVVRLAESLGRPPLDSWGYKALLVVGVALGFISLAFTHEIYGPAPRWLVSGIPAFVVVVCAVLLERVHDIKVTNRWVILAGDASYAMYLIHAYVVFGILRVVLGDHRMSELAGQLAAIGLMLASTLAAIVIHRLYEQPILRMLKRRFIVPKPRPRQVAPSETR
jgi:peptidoglycan/LPS O-acetylase OafA/YrhL